MDINNAFEAQGPAGDEVALVKRMEADIRAPILKGIHDTAKAALGLSSPLSGQLEGMCKSVLLNWDDRPDLLVVEVMLGTLAHMVSALPWMVTPPAVARNKEYAASRALLVFAGYGYSNYRAFRSRIRYECILPEFDSAFEFDEAVEKARSSTGWPVVTGLLPIDELIAFGDELKDPSINEDGTVAEEGNYDSAFRTWFGVAMALSLYRCLVIDLDSGEISLRWKGKSAGYTMRDKLVHSAVPVEVAKQVLSRFGVDTGKKAPKGSQIAIHALSTISISHIIQTKNLHDLPRRVRPDFVPGKASAVLPHPAFSNTPFALSATVCNVTQVDWDKGLLTPNSRGVSERLAWIASGSAVQRGQAMQMATPMHQAPLTCSAPRRPWKAFWANTAAWDPCPFIDWDMKDRTSNEGLIWLAGATSVEIPAYWGAMRDTLEETMGLNSTGGSGVDGYCPCFMFTASETRTGDDSTNTGKTTALHVLASSADVVDAVHWTIEGAKPVAFPATGSPQDIRGVASSVASNGKILLEEWQETVAKGPVSKHPVVGLDNLATIATGGTWSFTAAFANDMTTLDVRYGFYAVSKFLPGANKVRDLLNRMTPVFLMPKDSPERLAKEQDRDLTAEYANMQDGTVALEMAVAARTHLSDITALESTLRQQVRQNGKDDGQKRYRGERLRYFHAALLWETVGVDKISALDAYEAVLSWRERLEDYWSRINEDAEEVAKTITGHQSEDIAPEALFPHLRILPNCLDITTDRRILACRGEAPSVKVRGTDIVEGIDGGYSKALRDSLPAWIRLHVLEKSNVPIESMAALVANSANSNVSRSAPATEADKLIDAVFRRVPGRRRPRLLGEAIESYHRRHGLPPLGGLPWMPIHGSIFCIRYHNGGGRSRFSLKVCPSIDYTTLSSLEERNAIQLPVSGPPAEAAV